MDASLYKTVQERLDENSGPIGDLFQDTLEKLSAPLGFFGYEDLEGYIRICKCKGKYFHLHKDEGFTGTVFKNGKAEICDMKGAFQDSTSRVQAEMAAPVFLEDEIIGVILLDSDMPNSFNQSDLKILISYAEKLGAILSKREPWPFRHWWQKYEHRRINDYRLDLISKLTTQFLDINNISAATALAEDGNIVDLRPLDEGPRRVTFKGSTADEVIASGKRVLHPETVTRGELAVPFPHVGPIKGVVCVENFLEDNKKSSNKLSGNLLNEIERIVESTNFGYFADTPDPEDPSARFYSIFLRCASSQDPIEDIVKDVVLHTRNLCATDVHIYMAKDALGKKLEGSGTFCTLVSQKELQDRLRTENLTSTRPHAIKTSDDNLISPVWVENDIIACIEAKMNDYSDLQYDLPVLEVISTALSDAFQIHNRNAKMSELSEMCIDLSISETGLLMKFSEYARLIIGANSFLILDIVDGKMKLLVSSEKPHFEKDQYEQLINAFQSFETLGVKSNIQNVMDFMDSMEPGDTENYEFEKIRKDFMEFKIKSMITKKIRLKSSHYRILMGCTIQGKSYKPSFGVKDETNMNILGNLIFLINQK